VVFLSFFSGAVLEKKNKKKKRAKKIPHYFWRASESIMRFTLHSRQLVQTHPIGHRFGIKNHPIQINVLHAAYGLVVKSMVEDHLKGHGVYLDWRNNGSFRTNDVIMIGNERFVWVLHDPFVVEDTGGAIHLEDYMEQVHTMSWLCARTITCMELFRRLDGPNWDKRIFPFFLTAVDLTWITTPYGNKRLGDPTTLTLYNITVLGREYVYATNEGKRVFHEYLVAYLLKLE